MLKFKLCRTGFEPSSCEICISPRAPSSVLTAVRLDIWPSNSHLDRKCMAGMITSKSVKKGTHTLGQGPWCVRYSCMAVMSSYVRSLFFLWLLIVVVTSQLPLGFSEVLGRRLFLESVLTWRRVLNAWGKEKSALHSNPVLCWPRHLPIWFAT